MYATVSPLSAIARPASRLADAGPFSPDPPEEPSDLEWPGANVVDDESWDVFLDDEDIEPLPEPGDFWVGE